jgi:hypothetical protein
MTYMYSALCLFPLKVADGTAALVLKNIWAELTNAELTKTPDSLVLNKMAANMSKTRQKYY